MPLPFDRVVAGDRSLPMKKQAIVTGAAAGIGAGIAEHLSAAGWSVHRLDIETGDGILRCDVSNERSVAEAFEGLSDALSDGLDLLVNNAGIAGADNGPVEDLSLQEWHRRLGTNLTGPFLMARSAVPHLRRAAGSIVNITSTRAFMSEPNSEAYAASKGGLTALTHALAISLGPRVRVNAIAPGWIHTDPKSRSDLRDIDHSQHPAGRVGKTSDIAEAVLWLAEAEFVTAETVVIDGGMTRKMIYED